MPVRSVAIAKRPRESFDPLNYSLLAVANGADGMKTGHLGGANRGDLLRHLRRPRPETFAQAGEWKDDPASADARAEAGSRFEASAIERRMP